MNLKGEIEKIKFLLDKHMTTNPNHKKSCLELKEKLDSFETDLEHEKNISDFLYWSRWFAPRIIFEGIGDKEILNVFEKINQNYTAY